MNIPSLYRVCLAAFVFVSGTAYASVPFGDGGAALEGALDAITTAPTAGDTSVDVVNDVLADSEDSYWSSGASGSFLNIIANNTIDVSGMTFGIYDAADPSNRVELFAGTDSTGDRVQFTILTNGTVELNNGFGPQPGRTFAGNLFGFYLEQAASGGGSWKSDTQGNIDQLDHMAAYQGQEVDDIQIFPVAPGLWAANEYIFGWEESAAPGSDQDYDDFVVIIESITPTDPPEPVLGSLGDYVWEDLNGDGIQNDGDTGIEGVTVMLLDCNDNVLSSTTTLADGSYLFSNLVAGGYKVKFTAPAGFGFTSANAGGESVDSDAELIANGMGTTTCITLGAGENNLDVDAGLVQTASLGDYVWEDLNGDGIQDDGEPGVAGVTVNLLSNPNGDASCNSGDEQLLTSTTTDNTGFYQFTGLLPDDYCVQFVRPSGTTFTQQDQGDDATDSDADPTTGRTANTNLSAGENDPTLDAGIVRPASLGDFVWFDMNRDGIQDSGELGIEGVTVELFDCSGTLLDSTTTAADGSYLFDDLAPGGYVVKFTQLSGYTFSPTGQGTAATDSDANTSTGESGCITLASGENNPTIDAGLYPTNSRLGDYVWEDSNANGIQDDGDTGIGGVVVELLSCSGDVLDSTTTASDGSYYFNNLPAGSYRVRFDLNTVPTGFILSPINQGADDVDSDADSTGLTACVTLNGQDENLTLDAGFYQPASLGDFVWLDENEDGIQDPTEPGVGGVTVMLLDCSGNVLDSTTTASDGSYGFGGLVPGGYTVMFAPDPALYTLTTQDAGLNDARDSDANIGTGKTGCITLASGENNPTIDAGLIPVPVAQCDLSVSATCAIIPPLSSGFVCSDAKPIDTLQMKWTGQANVTVVAHYGKVDDAELSTVTGVNNGEVVSISGFAGAGNDIEWEVFTAGGDSLGISRFHMSCSDNEMNGPEDCGSVEGDGKGINSGFNTDWLLEGLIGENGDALQCTPPAPGPGAESCEFSTPAGPHCQGKVESISLRYIGGDCTISNTQEDKAECLVSGSAGSPVRIKVSDGGSKVYLDTGVANVTVGDVVVASASTAGEDDFGSNTVLEIFSSTGNLVQEIEFHTSCSKELNLGDRFGAVDVVGLDTTEGGSASVGVDVQYSYVIVNNSIEAFADEASDSFGSLGSLSLAANGGTANLSRTQFVMPDAGNVFTNTLSVSGNLEPSGTACSAQDSVPVTREQPPTPPGPQLECGDIKPLTHLSMIWDGPSGVNVLTAAGEYFADVQAGNQITFDVADLGNEVGMTLSGNVTGASSFHVSCSDGDMDGPEDCGSAQGNSKDNDSSLNNDWLFDGMSGESGSFVCDLPNTGTVAPSDNPGTGGGGDSITLLTAEVDGNKLKLEMENLSSGDLLIESVSVTWPLAAVELKKMKFAGDFVKDIESTDGTTNVPTDKAFESDSGKRTIESGKTERLEIEFDNNFEDEGKTLADFTVTVEFDDGSVVTLP